MYNNEGPKGVHYYPVIGGAAPVPQPRTAARGPLALYVHIPFCDKRCYFCEFAVVAGGAVTDSMVNEYLQALKDEMHTFLATTEQRPVIELIQLGGGTPTSLSAQALSDLLGFIFDRFDCSTLKEIIVEGFPNSITEDRIAILERIPHLKLNIGVQSFHAESLEMVGREHGANAEAAIARAVASKIVSVGVDLIFGLPLSSARTVRSDIERCFALGVEHCALYPLWIYEKTALESRMRSGTVVVPGFDLQKQQLVEGAAVFSSLGFRQYTVFHYALTEAARHRYGLWQMLGRNWVGFGMSAMSHLDGNIYFNDRNIRSYLQKMKVGASVSVENRQLSTPEQMKFVFLYGLRLQQYPATSFSDRFGVTAEEVFSSKLQSLQERGLLTHTNRTIELTTHGILALRAIEDYINSASDAALEDRRVFVEA